MANSILDGDASLKGLSVSAYLTQQLKLFDDNEYKQIDIESLDVSFSLSMIDKKKDKNLIQDHMQSETDNHVLIRDLLAMLEWYQFCLPISLLLLAGNNLEFASLAEYNALALSPVPAIGGNVFGTQDNFL